jgi:hypothetical protein
VSLLSRATRASDYPGAKTATFGHAFGPGLPRLATSDAAQNEIERAVSDSEVLADLIATVRPLVFLHENFMAGFYKKYGATKSARTGSS